MEVCDYPSSAPGLSALLCDCSDDYCTGSLLYQPDPNSSPSCLTTHECLDRNSPDTGSLNT